MFQLQFMIENPLSDLLTLITTLTISQSCGISSQRPNRVNLSPAGTKTYEIVGNRWVNEIFRKLNPEFQVDVWLRPLHIRLTQFEHKSKLKCALEIISSKFRLNVNKKYLHTHAQFDQKFPLQ